MKLVLHMLATLCIIGIISGGLLSQINEWAEPKIAEHRKAATEKAIFEVQPEAKSYKTIEAEDLEYYQVFDADSNLYGYALPYEGNGFQGKIRLMIGMDCEFNELTGLKILEQVETPGLGTRVTESNFTDQFKGLKSLPQIDWVKGVAPSKDNEIQAITGATISSKSVVFIMNEGLKKLRSAKQGGVK